MFAPEGETRPAEPVYHRRSGIRERVLAELAAKGPSTSNQLAVRMGVKVDVIQDAIRPLMVAGLVSATIGAWRRHVYALVPR